MATTNSAVTLGATLSLSVTSPQIGTSATTQLAYADGGLGEDSIKNITTSGFTACNPSLASDVMMMITVTGQTGLTGVIIEAGSTQIGTIPAPAVGAAPISVLLPVSTTVIISAKAVGAAANIGVTYVQVTANV